MELYRPYGYRNRSGYPNPINPVTGCSCSYSNQNKNQSNSKQSSNIQCNSKPECHKSSSCTPSSTICTPCSEGIPMPIPEYNMHHFHKKPGMAYVPYQEWGELLDMANALCEGTAFKELDLVFCGSRGNCR